MKSQSRKAHRREGEGKELPFSGQSNQPPLSPSCETEEKDKVMKYGPVGLNKNKSETMFY